MAIEWEIKLAARPEVLRELASDPEIGKMALSREEKRMESVYYDTEDLDLGAQRWTLRQRSENGEAVVTFKTAREGYAHGEWEYAGTLAEAAERLPAMGTPEALREILQKPLHPVCGASFTRQAILLRLEDGSTAELALDEGRLLNGPRTAPLCEIELELKSGDTVSVQVLAALIRERYGLKEEHKSKFARARAL